jgi:hypothetical protein
MKTVLLVLQTALGIIPNVIDIIKAVEIPGNGAAKLATVTSIVIAAFEELAPEIKAMIGADKLASFAGKIVNIIVGFLNAVGILKKSA